MASEVTLDAPTKEELVCVELFRLSSMTTPESNASMSAARKIVPRRPILRDNTHGRRVFALYNSGRPRPTEAPIAGGAAALAHGSWSAESRSEAGLRTEPNAIFITRRPRPEARQMEMPMMSFIVKGVKFAIAGGLGVLTGLAIQYLLTSTFHVYYLDSAVVGYGAGFVVNYCGNILNGNIKLKQ